MNSRRLRHNGPHETIRVSCGVGHAARAGCQDLIISRCARTNLWTASAPAFRRPTNGHLEQWSILTPDWTQVSGWVLFSIVFPASFFAHCFVWNTADDSTVFMP